MGVRSFLLLSLLGSLAGGLSEIWISSLISLFALSLIVVSYFNQTRKTYKESDFGLTTEFAAGIVFCLGYLTHKSPTLSALVGPLVAVVLFSKKTLHQFTKSLKPAELQAALLLFLFAVVVINLLPPESVDPWGIFYPKKFGYLIIILASFEFLTYVIAKIFGEKKSLILTGFLGGFASSTAVFVSSMRHAKSHPKHTSDYAAAAIAAKIASMLELLVILFFLSKGLFTKLLIPVLASSATGAIFVFFITRSQAAHKNSALILKSPLDWKGVFRLSIILAAILALISWSKIQFGESASMIVSFLTAAFELHGVTIANATLFAQKQIELNASSANIVFAICASILAKILMALAFERGPFFKKLSGVFFAMLVTLLVITYFLNH